MTKLKNAIENYVTIRQFGRKHICLGGLWTLRKMAKSLRKMTQCPSSPPHLGTETPRREGMGSQEPTERPCPYNATDDTMSQRW